jgi:hypothetical protein
MSRIIPAVLAVCQFLFSAPIVNLTIEECAGIARAGEPVVMGVPLPEAANYTDPALFTLRDQSGTIIPCEFRAACTWLKNPAAIRWLHLDFKADVAASATATVVLHSETSANPMASNLTVADQGTHFQVNTGVLRFNVRKANFNILDQVWIDETGGESYDNAHRIVSTHNRGLVHYLSVASEYLSSLDANSTVVVERSGPHSVLLKATGVLKNSSGDSSFHFITRIYACNNSKIVKIVNVIENRDVNSQSFINLAALNAEIPLDLGASKTALLGKPGGYEQAPLAAADTIFGYVARTGGNFSPYNYYMGGRVPAATVNLPAGPKPKDIGWISVSDGVKGCAAGRRNFREMFPSSMEVSGDGRLLIGFYSVRQAQTLPIYSGISRTLEARLVFFNDDTADELRAQAIGAANPLYAVAPPWWYCRATNGITRMVEKDPALFSAAAWSQIARTEAKMDTAWDTVQACIDYYPRLGNYNYGFLRWGDALHRVDPNTGNGIQDDWNLVWDGNYYGLPHMAFVRFARTGDLDALRFAIAHAQHVEDVHQMHWGPTNVTTGGNRYCPPTNHIAADGMQSMISVNNPSHHKTQGMFEHYYLTGSERALEAAIEGADWVKHYGYSFTVGDNLATYVRRLTHQLFSMCYAYQHTKDRAYHTNMYQNWFFIKQRILNGDSIGQTWQEGMFYEALEDMYHVCDDSIADSIPKYLKIQADRHYGEIADNGALGYAFLSRFYGDVYKNRSVVKMNYFDTYYDHTYKIFALYGRNLERTFYYFALPESLMVPIAVQDAGAGAADIDPISIYPNPFNPAVVISISDGHVGATRRVAPTLAIYDAHGRMVHQAEPESGTYTWSAAGLPAGIYLVKIRFAGKTHTRKIVLIR